jgi:hypothetical protein
VAKSLSGTEVKKLYSLLRTSSEADWNGADLPDHLLVGRDVLKRLADTLPEDEFMSAVLDNELPLMKLKPSEMQALRGGILTLGSELAPYLWSHGMIADTPAHADTQDPVVKEKRGLMRRLFGR